MNWQSWDWAHSNKLIKRRKTKKKWSRYVERFSRYDSGKVWEIAILSGQKVGISRNAGKWNKVAISHDALHYFVPECTINTEIHSNNLFSTSRLAVILIWHEHSSVSVDLYATNVMYDKYPIMHCTNLSQNALLLKY